CARSEGAYW
nr:immunoglobulin heavy chain junction region [Mus musculus]